MKLVRSVALPLSVLSSLALVGLSSAQFPVEASTGSVNQITVPEPPISSLDPDQNAPGILLDDGTILEGLFGYNSKNQVVPKIASSYKVSNGGTVWTFYLRKNARWSNGKPVTAQDFYYAWMRMINPKNTTSQVWQSFLTYVKGEASYYAGQSSASQVGLKVLNPYALQVTLTAPHNILGEMCIAGSMPLYPPVVKAHPGNWYLPQYFVGDGPYKVQSFTVNGNITLVKNPYYVPAPNDKIGNVQQINIVPTPTVPVEDFLAKKLDLAMITNPSDLTYIESHPTLKAQLVKQPANIVFLLRYDKSVDASPLDNQMVRRAIAMAINRAPLANSVLHGMGAAATSFGPPTWPPTKLEHALPYNVSEARQLLAKAGYPGGKGFPTLNIYTATQQSDPVQVPVAEAIAQELKQELGINFKIDPLAQAVDGDVVYNGLTQGIKPGYVIAGANAGWMDAGYLPMQADNIADRDGIIGPVSYRLAGRGSL